MSTEDMLKSSEYEKEMGYYDTEIGKEDLRQRKIEARKESLKKQIKTIKKISKKSPKIIRKFLKGKLKKAKKKKKLELKKAIQAEIGRRRLLQAIISKQKRPVNVLARIEDKIPNVLVKRRDEEIKPSFLRKGGLI